MRIGLFTDTYLPVVNGISYVVESTRKELEKRGHKVFIFAPSPRMRYKETDPNVIRFRAIKGISYKENLTSVFFPAREVRKIHQLNLDLIHFFTPMQVGMLGIYVAISENIPLVGQYCTDVYSYTPYYQANSWALAWLPAALPVISKYPREYWRDVMLKLRQKKVDEAWRQRVVAQVMRAVHDQCQRLIAPSQKMVAQLKSFGITAPITLLPNGLNPLPVEPERVNYFRRKFGLSEADKVILYAGRLAQEKNLELLIAAFGRVATKVPNAKLVLAGDFDHREELEEIAKGSSVSDKIIFTGMIPREQLGAMYGLADLFAFTSLTDTQGLVLHEAAYAGLPLVLIDTEVSEVFADGVNGLAAKNSAVDVAAKITRILNSPALYSQMSAASKRIASRYNESTQSGKLDALYKKLIV